MGLADLTAILGSDNGVVPYLVETESRWIMSSCKAMVK